MSSGHVATPLLPAGIPVMLAAVAALAGVFTRTGREARR
jgi:hypothetical protein